MTATNAAIAEELAIVLRLVVEEARPGDPIPAGAEVYTSLDALTAKARRAQLTADVPVYVYVSPPAGDIIAIAVDRVPR